MVGLESQPFAIANYVVQSGSMAFPYSWREGFMAKAYRIRELKIEVTRECPLTCLHCSSNGAPEATEKLDSFRVADLIREFANLGGETVAISGGEPLVYEDLPLILDVCRALDIQPDFYTTGICSNGLSLKSISEDTLELLSQSRAKVIFSLHGAHAKTHDALTQVEGSFNGTMIAIERALAAKISVGVHVVPTAININELTDMTRLLASMGIKKVSWLRFLPQGRGQLSLERLQLTKEQLRKLAQMRIKLQEACESVQIRTGSPFNILCPEHPAPCTAALSVLVVRPDGRALPCDAFKWSRVQDRFGNILSYSLSEVWQKSELLNQVRQIQESRSNSACASCPMYARCNSGCIAQKAIAAGRLVDGKDPDCLFDHAEVGSGEVEAIAVC